MADDLIRAIRTAAIAGGMDVAAAHKMERELRREWGGTRKYIAQNAPAETAQRGDESLQPKRQSPAPPR
jgi:hypothetical protein